MVRKSTALRRIKVMISSQCNRAFPAGGRTLTAIRKTIRTYIEAQEFLGHRIFDVWINEDSPGRGTGVNSLDACLDEVRKADILIVLATGHAGWSASDGDIGICHSELMTAHNASPAKIRVIILEGTDPLGNELAKSNERFRSYLDQINAFRTSVKTEADLLAAVDEAIADAVASLVGLGVREAHKGGFSLGDALEWSRLPYSDRSKRICETLSSALVESGGDEFAPRSVITNIHGRRVALHLHAAPGGLAIAASREVVGRPFLEDHRNIEGYGADVIGPIHIIGSHTSATEAQARAMMGFPDATFVTPGFGVFAADNVQQIQFALLKDCRDATTSRNAIHRFLQWLKESGEDAVVAERATRRRAIAEIIAAQISA